MEVRLDLFKIVLLIHAQLPLRVPCYDLAHVTDLRLDP